MKKNIMTIIALPFGLPILYLIAWGAASAGLFGEIGFGYYGHFNKAKRAIRQTGYVDFLKYSLHEDVTLENFHFRILTDSGRIVPAFFDDRMDIDQVCAKPKGIIVSSPWNLDGQSYGMEDLAYRLQGKGIQVRDFKDVLCNLDELVTLFEANYRDDTIPVITHNNDLYRQYLNIRIMGKGEKEFFGYSEQD